MGSPPDIISIDVTLLPRITCQGSVKMQRPDKYTYYRAHVCFISPYGIIEYQIQEKVVPSESTTDIATTLQVNEQPLVHELQKISFNPQR